MKDTKANHDKNSRDWVEVARQFGEKGIAIQRDASLSWDQKLEKQKEIAKKLEAEIKNDSTLKDEDKTKMLNSIKSYVSEWTKMHDLFVDAEKKEHKSKK